MIVGSAGIALAATATTLAESNKKARETDILTIRRIDKRESQEASKEKEKRFFNQLPSILLNDCHSSTSNGTLNNTASQCFFAA